VAGRSAGQAEAGFAPLCDPTEFAMTIRALL
jgi:hypothetical protein